MLPSPLTCTDVRSRTILCSPPPSSLYVTLWRQSFPDCQTISTEATKFAQSLQRVSSKGQLKQRWDGKVNGSQGLGKARTVKWGQDCKSCKLRIMPRLHSWHPSSSNSHLCHQQSPTVCISSFPARMNKACNLTLSIPPLCILLA